MRFNDVHKLVCAALKIDEPEKQRELRPFMLAHYCRHRSANAILALTRIEVERRAKERGDADAGTSQVDAGPAGGFAAQVRPVRR